MVLIGLISAIVSILMLSFMLWNGWFLLTSIWLSSTVIVITAGWLAVIFIQPRYPDWWAKHIAGMDRSLIGSSRGYSRNGTSSYL